MQTIDIHYAKEHLLKLVKAVKNGQEFMLQDAGKPVACLLPIKTDKIIRKAGAMRGKIIIRDDFDASLSLDDLIRGEKS